MNPDQQDQPIPNEETLKQFAGLPPEIQKALTSQEVIDALETIGREHGLLLDKVEMLLDVVTECLTGSLKPDRFSGEISSRLSISAEKARNITDEVNTRIFSAIREALKKVYPEPDFSVGHPEIARPSASSALSSVSMAGNGSQPPSRSTKSVDPYREPVE